MSENSKFVSYEEFVKNSKEFDPNIDPSSRLDFQKDLEKEYASTISRSQNLDNKALSYLGIQGIVFTIGISLTMSILQLNVITNNVCSTILSAIFIIICIGQSILLGIAMVSTYMCYRARIAYDNICTGILSELKDKPNLEQLGKDEMVIYSILALYNNNKLVTAQLESKWKCLRISHYFSFASISVMFMNLVILLIVFICSC